MSITAVGLAAPDIVFVEVEDPAFGRGHLLALEEPRAEPVGTWVRHEGSWGLVVGRERDHLRMADAPPGRFLDRDAADDASAYGPLGGRTVTAVHRKSMPYDSGLFPGEGGEERSGASFRHTIYLQLDGPLAPGRHTLEVPGVATRDFAFDDKATRAVSIRATQLGHRAGDRAKTGFLSLWLPGGPEGGAVDFRRHGIERFHVLDASGRSVFEGEVRLRAGPHDPEPGNGLSADLVDILDAGAPSLPIDAIRNGRVFTARAHGFSHGERVGLQRLGGDQDASALFGTVAEVEVNSFTLAEIDGELPGDAAPGATAQAARRANRAATYVFELDYTRWRPDEPGVYRLHVPGLGVSDPFEIADDVWLRSARLSLAGLYGHRSGIPLDDRFGYPRPAAFRPGEAGFEVLRTRLPFAWSSEFPGGFVPFETAADRHWITDVPAPEAWGGYMDAGDWDRRIQHLEVASLMLEVAETLAGSGLDPDLGVPPSSTVLPDPAYGGADALPDTLHEAIWGLDFYRRLQTPEGAVPGGIESAGHPQKGEPSFMEHRTVFLYAPDHLSSYRYAAVAAKLARVLGLHREPRLAALFGESARAAWRWAETAHADPDAAFTDAVAAGEAAGIFDTVPWAARREALQTQAGELRVAAAAALFRLDGEPGHAALFEDAWRGGWDFYVHKGDAAWDYLRSEGRDEAIAAEVAERLTSEAESLVSAQDGLAYPSMKHPFAPAGWGQGGAPDYSATMLLMRAHGLNGDPRILAAMERAHHAILGANQTGLSLMTGAGVRDVTGVLHEDSLAMGVPVPAGITVYGWAPQWATAHGWIFGPGWSPLPETLTGPDGRSRRIEPDRFALPYFEYLVQHPAVIMQMEYTVHQTIGPMAALALYLATR